MIMDDDICYFIASWLEISPSSGRSLHDSGLSVILLLLLLLVVFFNCCNGDGYMQIVLGRDSIYLGVTQPSTDLFISLTLMPVRSSNELQSRAEEYCRHMYICKTHRLNQFSPLFLYESVLSPLYNIYGHNGHHVV